MQFQSSDPSSSSPALPPQDDIDQLFQKLQRVEVPVFFFKQFFVLFWLVPAAQLYPLSRPGPHDPEATQEQKSPDLPEQ
jgi:hypothetical protein